MNYTVCTLVMAGFLGRVCGVVGAGCSVTYRSTLLHIPLPPALHPHPDKSQPAKMAVLPHAADFLRVPVNPSLLICWVFSNASASLHFLGGILMYGSTLRFACGRAPCICYSINPSLLKWLFYRMPQIFFVSR